jgi:hypothetical protein
MKDIIKKILKESDDLSWIQDISDEVPSWNDRTKLPIEDLVFDYMLENTSLFNELYREEYYTPTEEYKLGFTPEEWDDYGFDQWESGDWKENGEWDNTPNLTDWSIMEPLLKDCSKWEHMAQENVDWDLDAQSFTDRLIWQRKSDGRYFGATIYGSSYDGWEGNDEFLREIFQKKVTIFV